MLDLSLVEFVFSILPQLDRTELQMGVSMFDTLVIGNYSSLDIKVSKEVLLDKDFTWDGLGMVIEEVEDLQVLIKSKRDSRVTSRGSPILKNLGYLERKLYSRFYFKTTRLNDPQSIIILKDAVLAVT